MDRVKCSSPPGYRPPLPETLRSTLSDWIMQNFNMPSDASTLIVFLVLIFLTWYIVNWAVRLLLSLFWPIITVAALIMFLPYIREGNFGDVVPNITETAKDVVYKLGIILGQFAKRIGQFIRCPQD
ncbi:unnamed protein product [Hermetia illucens]|uniref:Uncharacterized protein n=1 Tax=Hermetia illucens TaxID=343691 RepID=A0A7R8UKM1_HERIL|nr:uncharacterized protein LOC119649478 [Hermetia illucens]CAD7082287.1 unnamed protein product [Hermetia illucens]